MKNYILLITLAVAFQGSLIGKDEKPKRSSTKIEVSPTLHLLKALIEIRFLKSEEQAKALSKFVKEFNGPNMVHLVSQFIDQTKMTLRQEMVERASVSIFNSLGKEATVKFLENRKEVTVGMIQEIKEAKFLYYGIDGRIFIDLKTPQLIPSKIVRRQG